MLGQSYGGLCILTYLSFAPDGLKEALITGGVPGIGTPVDDIYTRHVGADGGAQPPLLRALSAGPRADARAQPTSSRIRPLGHMLGMSDGFERLHYILELPPDSPAFREDTRDPLELDAQPDLRAAARGLLGRRGA